MALASATAVVVSPGVAGAQPTEAPAPSVEPSQEPAPEPARPMDVQAYDVSGNSLLTADEIERAVYPYTGPGQLPEDVEKARAALERAYHAKGYQSVAVQIPEQSGAFGIIALAVTEARIRNVQVKGASGASSAALIRELPSLTPGQVPNLDAAQRELGALNRFPERQVTPLITPSTEPGTIDVELEVERKFPLHASVQLSNDHNQGTKPLRLSATLRDSNLWGLGHQLFATYVVAPEEPSNLEVFSGSYLAPLTDKWSVLAYGYKSNSNIASLGGTNVLGDGYAIGGRATLSLTTRPPAGTAEGKGTTYFHTIGIGLEYKNFNETISLPLLADAIRTPIDYTAFVASYGLAGISDRRTVNATVSLITGLRGLGAQTVRIGDQDVPIFGNKRGSFRAKPNFVHVNLDADASQTIGKDVILFGRVSAQVSDGPLISNEQFAIGGLDTVRGFFQSQAVGDRGIVGALELRSPSVASQVGDLVDEWRVFGFTDYGAVRIVDPGEGVKSFDSLWSIGVGTRLRLFGILSGEMVIGLPLQSSLRGNGPFATFSVKAEY